MQEDWAVDQRYDVLYIAAHGDAGGLVDESGTYMSMRWLASRLADTCVGRVVFLAGCGTLDVSDRKLASFASTTRATAVAGYGRAVDWLESAQMDLITLAALAKHGPGATGVWVRSPSATFDEIAEEYPGFADRLEWQFKADDDVEWRKPRRSSADGVVAAIDELRRICCDASVDAATRERAVAALGALRDRSTLGTFTALARDPRVPPSVRGSAVRGLGGIPGKRSMNSLDQLARRLEAVAEDQHAVEISKVVRATLKAREA